MNHRIQRGGRELHKVAVLAACSVLFLLFLLLLLGLLERLLLLVVVAAQLLDLLLDPLPVLLVLHPELLGEEFTYDVHRGPKALKRRFCVGIN